MKKEKKTIEDKAVEEFRAKGKYSEDHNDICKLIEGYKCKRTAIDLGCHKGLLAHRLLNRDFFDKIIGIEQEKDHVDNAVHIRGLQYENFKINKENLPRLQSIINRDNVKDVIARKILPEIYEQDKEMLKILPKLFFENGVKRIIIEGKKKTLNERRGLYRIQKEIHFFDEYYKLFAFYNECCILERR